MTESRASSAELEAAVVEAPIAELPITREYKDLIKEVYINPIRSAIIVDDVYPTLDILLDYQNEKLDDAQKNSLSKKDSLKLAEVIDACRGQNRPWLVDVHDGSGLEKYEDANLHFKRLHQSDLLILDYNLDGDGGGNQKCFNILTSLSSNKYFNLVVIYTACSEQHLTNRVIEVAQSLTYRDSKFLINPAAPEETENQALEGWERVDVDITDKLSVVFDASLFLKLCHESDRKKWPAMVADTPFGQMLNAAIEIIGPDGIQSIIVWALNNYITKNKDKLGASQLGKVEFIAGVKNWIRTNSLFITIVRKNEKASELPNLLLQALEASDPSPHRLLMTKIRNVLDEEGIAAERAVLNKAYIQAGWLKEMVVAKSDGESNWKIKRTISHHWEALAQHVNPEIQKFAKELFDSVLETEQRNLNAIISRFTGLNSQADAQKIMQEWNSYVCSKEVDGHHLMTGHILEIQRDEKVEHWLCLSPICDLVPRDKNRLWAGSTTTPHDLIPFKAIRLVQDTPERGISNITKNEHILFGSGDELKCYRYAKDSIASPTWNQFFAHSSGQFSDDRKLNLSCLSFKYEPGEAGVKEEVKGMEIIEIEATLISQLRYEYALHLLQKLGGSFSRIGLEFAPL